MGLLLVPELTPAILAQVPAVQALYWPAMTPSFDPLLSQWFREKTRKKFSYRIQIAMLLLLNIHIFYGEDIVFLFCLKKLIWCRA